jgi:hypothetical protein
MNIQALLITAVTLFSTAALASPSSPSVLAALDATAHTAVGRVMAPDPALMAHIDANVPGPGINLEKTARAGALPVILAARADSQAADRLFSLPARPIASR